MITETMVCGENFIIEFQVMQNNAPENISDYSAKIDMRKDSIDGALIRSWNDSSPELSRSNGNGTVTLTIPAEVTNSLNFQQSFIDLLLVKDGGGRRSTLLRITLDRGVTR